MYKQIGLFVRKLLNEKELSCKKPFFSASIGLTWYIVCFLFSLLIPANCFKHTYLPLVLNAKHITQSSDIDTKYIKERSGLDVYNPNKKKTRQKSVKVENWNETALIELVQRWEFRNLLI